MSVHSNDRAAQAEQIRANQLAWGRDWVARNAEAIIARYAPDAVLFVPGEPPTRGVASFAPFIREILKNPNFSLAWTVDEVRVGAGGDIGFVTGRYVQHNPTAEGRSYTVETGSYVTTYEKRNGAWLGVAEINTPGPLDRTDGLSAESLRSPPTPASANSTAQSKAVVLDFVRIALVDRKPREAFAKYAAAEFVTHAPDIADAGAAGTIEFLERLYASLPAGRWEIARAAAEGDLVFVHLRVLPAPGARPIAIVEIYRTESGKVAEHWDVVRMPSDADPNPLPPV